MEATVIRPIEMKDLLDLMDLEEESFKEDAWKLEDYAIWADDGYKGVVLAGESHDRMWASCWYGFNKGMGGVEIASLATFEQFRGKGFARRLLQHVMALHPTLKFLLNVRVDNVAAVALYESEGFKKVRIDPKLYHDGSDAYYMEKLPQS